MITTTNPSGEPGEAQGGATGHHHLSHNVDVERLKPASTYTTSRDAIRRGGLNRWVSIQPLLTLCTDRRLPHVSQVTLTPQGTAL